MSYKVIDNCPAEIRYFPGGDDIAGKMDESHVRSLMEIFNTPLTGSFNWDYTVQDNRIKRLYELGKKLNWNVETDIAWSPLHPKDQSPTKPEFNLFAEFEPYQKMPEKRQIEFDWHRLASSMSQFLHGEQGALLVASQLVSCAPTYNAKLYAASQTFDEARHVEVFNKFIQRQVGIMYPISSNLKLLLDKILQDARWDLKFIGMQIIIEGLALAAFKTAEMGTQIDILKNILKYVIRDEARHVAFGVNYLETHVQTLTPEEKQERAEFAYEACVVMRDRLVGLEIYKHFGWDVEAAQQYVKQRESRMDFGRLLFGRVMPNLRKIGLLTDEIRPKFDQLGVLEYEFYEDDGVIDWAELEKPLTPAVMAATGNAKVAIG